MNKKVQIKDQIWFADKGALGAVQFHTLNDHRRVLDKKTWDTERFGMVCTTPDVFGESRKLLEVLCSYYGYCEYEEVKAAVHHMMRMQHVGEASMKQIQSEMNEEVIYE